MDFRGKQIDLVGRKNLFFGISLAVIVIGMVSWIAFGLNLGIDFKGGGLLQYRIPYSLRPASGGEPVFLEKTRAALEQKGLKRVRLQVAGGNTLVIATDARDLGELRLQDRTVRESLGTTFTDGKDASGKPEAWAPPEGQQLVGPVIGEELRRNAINGVVLGVLFIALWIYIRYNFAGDGLRYAVAGIVALVHDVLVLIGLFALIGKIDPRIEVDGSFIAALLTVVGYSINDSVVIFDRLRENLRLRRKEPFNRVVNDSLLETMSRSINTGLTVLIMLFALLLFGGESIYNFVLAMLVGIASGLYSSIFNASMVLVAWHEHDEKKAALAKASRPAVGRSPARVTPATAGPSLAASGSAPALPSQRNVSSPAYNAASNGSTLPGGATDGAAGARTDESPADGASTAPGSAGRSAADRARRARQKRRF